MRSRLKHPELIHASVASSAPVFATFDMLLGGSLVELHLPPTATRGLLALLLGARTLLGGLLALLLGARTLLGGSWPYC